VQKELFLLLHKQHKHTNFWKAPNYDPHSHMTEIEKKTTIVAGSRV
jgi:hypothetical protein